MDINTYFDKIFIINLDKRTDRWQSIVNNLKAYNIYNYERITAIQPHPSHFRNKPNIYSNLSQRSKKTSNKPSFYVVGCIGCRWSHIKAIKLAKERNYENILILEDDAYFRDTSLFPKIIEEIKDLNYDILLFSGNHRSTPIPISNNIYKIKTTYSTIAYSVRSHLFDTIINEADNSGNEIDIFYCNSIYSKNNSYCIIPHMIGSIKSYSDITSKISENKFL